MQCATSPAHDGSTMGAAWGGRASADGMRAANAAARPALRRRGLGVQRLELVHELATAEYKRIAGSPVSTA